MAGRRGARSGRGWDALPPRAARRVTDEHPSGEPPGDGTERGNVPTRRRGSPGGPSADTPDGETRAAASGGGWRRRAPAGGGARAARGGRFAAGEQRPEQSESERAREICLRRLAMRPCTRAELAKALAGKGISVEVIAEVLDRYDEVGIIDDAAFARAWVSSRHHGRGLARRALATELRQRGVAADVAGEALETLDDEEEAATAKALVERKLRTTRGAPEAVFRRLVGMLARKGYPAGVAIRTVKDALAERDAEAAEFAEQIDPDAMADESMS